MNQSCTQTQQWQTHSVNVCDALALVECNILLVIQALNLDECGVVVLVHLRPATNKQRQQPRLDRTQELVRSNTQHSRKIHANIPLEAQDGTLDVQPARKRRTKHEAGANGSREAATAAKSHDTNLPVASIKYYVLQRTARAGALGRKTSLPWGRLTSNKMGGRETADAVSYSPKETESPPEVCQRLSFALKFPA